MRFRRPSSIAMKNRSKCETSEGGLKKPMMVAVRILPIRPLISVWDEVQSEHGNCLGRKCPTYNQCFYYQARRRVWNADIIVVNHALFFSDLALRREGASILPDYDVVILDEAHTVEQVASDHLGLAISNGQLDYLYNRLYNDRSQKRTVASIQFERCSATRE